MQFESWVGNKGGKICLGDVYIMDHEVIPCCSKICDWSLNLSRDHFGLHEEKKKNVRVTMDLDPKRHVFRPTLSTVMVRWVLRWERQKRSSCCNCEGTMAGKCVCVFFPPNISRVMREEEGDNVKHGENSQKCPFWINIEKTITSTFGCMVTSLGARLVCT